MSPGCRGPVPIAPYLRPALLRPAPFVRIDCRPSAADDDPRSVATAAAAKPLPSWTATGRGCFPQDAARPAAQQQRDSRDRAPFGFGPAADVTGGPACIRRPHVSQILSDRFRDRAHVV